MYKRKKLRIGRMSGDRLVKASKKADEKIERAIKPIRIPKMKSKYR